MIPPESRRSCRRLWTFSRSWPTEIPGYRAVELYVGDATLELSPAVVADALGALLPSA